MVFALVQWILSVEQQAIASMSHKGESAQRCCQDVVNVRLRRAAGKARLGSTTTIYVTEGTRGSGIRVVLVHADWLQVNAMNSALGSPSHLRRAYVSSGKWYPYAFALVSMLSSYKNNVMTQVCEPCCSKGA